MSYRDDGFRSQGGRNNNNSGNNRQGGYNNNYSGNNNRQGGYDNRGRGDGGRGGRGGGRGGRGGRGGFASEQQDKVLTLRPTDGRVLANYFKLNIKAAAESVYKHGIDFNGEESTFVRRKIINKLLQDIYGADLKNIESSILFDDTCIYSRMILKVKQGADVDVQVGKSVYVITLVSVAKVSDNDPQFLNLVFNAAMNKSSLQRIGRGHFDKKELDVSRFNKARDLQIFPGYRTEVIQKLVATRDKITTLVNIDTISKVLCKITVADTLYDIQGDNKWTPALKKKACGALVNTIVYTRYNYQAYTIEGIDFERNSLSKFSCRNRRTGKEEEQTYVKYYAEKGEVIQYPDQPLLKAKGRNGARIHLVPELCLLTDLQPEAKADLPKICSVKPPERMTRIKNLPEQLMGSEKSKNLLNSFGVSVEAEMVPVPTKLLPAPTLYMPGKKGIFQYEGPFGPATARDLFFGSKAPRSLFIIVTYDDYKECFDLMNTYLKEISLQLKEKQSPIVVGRVERIPIKQGEYHVPSLTAALNKLPKKEDAQNVLYLSFLYNKRMNKDNYNSIKEFCLHTGIISQNIDTANARHMKNSQTIAANITKQVMNKFGTLCWWAPIHTLSPAFAKKTLMFIGIDVYHAKKTFEEKDKWYRQRRSIGAFIAVIITPDGKFHTSCHVNPHRARRELISASDSETSSMASGRSSGSGDDEEKAGSEKLEGFGITQKDALREFINRTMAEHNVKPDFIIVYRDGVAESQLDQVKAQEVKQVRAACSSAALTYIVAQKRISTRFMVKTSNGEVGNPCQGTVVDEFKSTIYDDFYLISLVNNISTVKPVRYVVIEDDKKIPRPDLLQVTNTLCYLYPNWADAIKLPFPTQLAHKLAYLMGEIKVDDPRLHESLFKTYCYFKNSLNPDDWTLTSKNKELDLSLTFRLSGLVSNSKLELKRRQVSVADSQVTIALQLPEGGRVQGVFNPQTSLWAIISHYEQNLKQNFTKNEGPVEGSKDKTPVYKQPVINFTNKEIATNRELRTTTLQSLGLTKGSGLLRLFFRPSTKSLAQIEEEEKLIEEETKVREEEQEQVKKQIAEKEQAERDKKAQEERERQQQTFAYEEEERRKLQAREAELKAEAERRAQAEKKRLEQLDQHEREKAIQERVMFEKWKAEKERKELDMRAKQLKDQEEWDAWVQGKTTSTNTNTNLSTSSDKMEIDEPIKQVKPLADRQIKVFAPASAPFDPATIELPEDFYNVTKEDLDREMRARNERRRQEEQDKSHLKTREMREMERLQRLSKWNKTMIRIRFPDRVELQANFLPNEYTNTLVDFVRSNLADPSVNFYLYTSPPIQRLPMNKTFMQLSFLPAVLVHFGLEQGSQVYGSFLKKDLLVEIQEKLPPPIMHVSAVEVSSSVNPAPVTQTNTNTNRHTEDKPKKTADKSVVPKWFKKQ